MKGWDYLRHLKGRLFSVILHGDTEGAESVRRSLAEWLKSMDLVPAGPLAEIDRYIGYWEPTSPITSLSKETRRFSTKFATRPARSMRRS
ncbi:hypothetical protein QO004_004272 [Rhizobium mesoamericanum]|nr:hypothetical protein [Rhizobium mesoamericanum]